MLVKLIADSGATKCDWCLINNGKKKNISTLGISPYFFSDPKMEEIVREQVVASIPKIKVDEVFFYGTGLGIPAHIRRMTKVLKKCFPVATVQARTDMHAAAIATCGDDKGVVAIMGTGSGACYYNGKKIVKSRLGLGYVLGDEASGAYFGKKVIQHYLYGIFDEYLMKKFDEKFATDRAGILSNVYSGTIPSKYLATFAIFLAENRGHYIVENIIEDGISEFIRSHLYKISESWHVPIHFVGSIANGFKDVIKEICGTVGLEVGSFVQKPLEGLIRYHAKR